MCSTHANTCFLPCLRWLCSKCLPSICYLVAHDYKEEFLATCSCLDLRLCHYGGVASSSWPVKYGIIITDWNFEWDRSFLFTIYRIALIFRGSKFSQIAVFENFVEIISWMCCLNIPCSLLLMSFRPAGRIHVVLITDRYWKLRSVVPNHR